MRRRSSAPQVRALLLSFPQVTTVANELGRPDDGTDPIGFYNDEYFVGLRPYDDPVVARDDPHEAAAHRGDSTRSSRRFPASSSTTRSRPKTRSTRPMTGLKSSLAVKIFGGDLQMLEAKAEAVRKTIAAVPGHHRHHRRARARASRA